jgi:alpha-tubulin suppressor-like RCC1 family protein
MGREVFWTTVLALLAAVVLAGNATPQSGVKAWGSQAIDSAWNEGTYVEVAAGYGHTLAVRSDGALVAWGYNTSGQCDLPPPQPGLTYVEIAAGGAHSVARHADGSLVAWGYNKYWTRSMKPARCVVCP